MAQQYQSGKQSVMYFTTKNAYSKDGKSSATFQLNDPLILDSNKNYDICLLEFSMYNVIPNIITGVNNIFLYSYNAVNFEIVFDQGLYGIQQIIDVISNETQEQTGLADLFDWYPDVSTSFLWVRFPHLGTTIRGNVAGSITDILGLGHVTITTTGINDWHKGIQQVKLNSQDSLRLHCDLVSRGSITDGRLEDVIQIINITASAGSRNLTRPQFLQPCKVTNSHINKITFSLTDELNKPLEYFSTSEDYDIQLLLIEY